MDEQLNRKVNLARKLLLQGTIGYVEAQHLLGLDDFNAYALFGNLEREEVIAPTSLVDAKLIKPRIFEDERGFFTESYNKERFTKEGIRIEFVQDNHSLSHEKGVLRGFHFQLPPYAQSKLVRVTRGSVYDVIVDLRRKSATYGHWEGFVLSADNHLELFIPQGFAHAFCTLEPDTEFMYKVDNFYHPEADGGIIWNDPDLNVNWPVKQPILSLKDRDLPRWRDLHSSF
jgi:dTDP-4-dehydrorhamnose 3,5-epimerase